jgi:FkbM family methyltransferase
MNFNFLLQFIVRHYSFKKGRSRITRFVKRNLSGVSISTDEFGNQFLLDLDNFIDNEIYLQGSFEKQNITILDDLVTKNRCRIFIDIGANLGFYTIFFASRSNIEKVYAFEPDPRNFSQLHANIFLNNLHDKVILYNVALSSKNGNETLYLSRKKQNYENYKLNTGTSSLIFNETRHSEQVAITIQARRLNDLVEIENQSVAIKIDVEGHEFEVLRGMDNFLKKNQCVILLEIFNDHFEAVNKYLEGMRYKAANFFQVPGTYIYLKNEG